eukprot:934806-Ditylum_brightwellii.AAC.1
MERRKVSGKGTGNKNQNKEKDVHVMYLCPLPRRVTMNDAKETSDIKSQKKEKLLEQQVENMEKF